MPVSCWILWFLVIWCAAVACFWGIVMPLLRRGPDGRADLGALWIVTKVIARFRHHTQFIGTDCLPAHDRDHDGLIVIANHTGGVDPVLVQSRCRFWIRWLMATDSMVPSLNWLWQTLDLIPVDRDGTDSGPLRAAIRHVRKGGAVGIFPEGRITLPARELRPFLPGIGLIVSKTKAPVLITWISGTPESADMNESVFSSSQSRVEFLGLYDFSDETDPAAITARLREILHDKTGWPYNDVSLPPGGSVAEPTLESRE